MFVTVGGRGFFTYQKPLIPVFTIVSRVYRLSKASLFVHVQLDGPSAQLYPPERVGQSELPA